VAETTEGPHDRRPIPLWLWERHGPRGLPSILPGNTVASVSGGLQMHPQPGTAVRWVPGRRWLMGGGPVWLEPTDMATNVALAGTITVYHHFHPNVVARCKSQTSMVITGSAHLLSRHPPIRLFAGPAGFCFRHATNGGAPGASPLGTWPSSGGWGAARTPAAARSAHRSDRRSGIHPPRADGLGTGVGCKHDVGTNIYDVGSYFG